MREQRDNHEASYTFTFFTKAHLSILIWYISLTSITLEKWAVDNGTFWESQTKEDHWPIHISLKCLKHHAKLVDNCFHTYPKMCIKMAEVVKLSFSQDNTSLQITFRFSLVCIVFKIRDNTRNLWIMTKNLCSICLTKKININSLKISSIWVLKFHYFSQTNLTKYCV